MSVATRWILQDAKVGKVVDMKLKLNIMVANQIFQMVLNHKFSGSLRSAHWQLEGGLEKEIQDECYEFKYLIVEMQHLKGLFMVGDYVPWLRPLDLGGIEKRMKALLRR